MNRRLRPISWMAMAAICLIALPAMAGGGGGGGGVNAVSVPALSPIVFVAAQAALLAFYVIRRRK